MTRTPVRWMELLIGLLWFSVTLICLLLAIEYALALWDFGQGGAWNRLR